MTYFPAKNAYRNRLLQSFRFTQRLLETRFRIKDVLYILVISLISIGLFKHYNNEAKLISPLPSQVQAENFNVTPLPSPTPTPVDNRIKKLEAFLKAKNSPLADYAQLIVEQADLYDIGWTRIVAISSIESGLGINCPDNSHNAWGMGKPFMYFDTWEDGIKFASKLIGNNYKLNENQGIKTKYCPSWDGCNPAWANHVTNISNEILAVN
jgi:hypothetical protein